MGKNFFLGKNFFVHLTIVVLGLIFISFLISRISSLWISDDKLTGLIGIISFLILLVISIGGSLKKVPQNEEWRTSLFGKKYRLLEAGPNFILPFNLEVIESQVFMGIQKMELNLDSTVDPGTNEVEFKDCSGVGVKAFFYFKFNDSEKATYNVEDPFSFIKEKCLSVLRDNLALYKINDALLLKNNFNKEVVACAFDLKPYLKNPKNIPDLKIPYENSEFYEMMKNIGVEPKDFDISSFRLTEKIIQERERTLAINASMDVAIGEKKIASVKKKTIRIDAEAKKEKDILDAEGTKQAKILEGEGEGSRISSILAASGVSSEEAASFINNNKKWDAISQAKSTDKVIFLDGNSEATRGAAFGVGVNSSRNSSSTSST